MKKKVDLARAWRDQDYYLSLTDEERASLGTHPAGFLTLEDTVLTSIAGGCSDIHGETYTCPPTISVCPPDYCT